MRFSKKLLILIDKAAVAEGISRTTWLENVCRAFLYNMAKTKQTSGAAAAEAMQVDGDVFD